MRRGKIYLVTAKWSHTSSIATVIRGPRPSAITYNIKTIMKITLSLKPDRLKTVTPERRVLRNYLPKGSKKGEYVCVVARWENEVWGNKECGYEESRERANLQKEICMLAEPTQERRFFHYIPKYLPKWKFIFANEKKYLRILCYIFITIKVYVCIYTHTQQFEETESSRFQSSSWKRRIITSTRKKQKSI